MIQSLSHLHSPSLDLFSKPVSLQYWGAQNWPQQYWVEIKVNTLQSAGNALPDAAQNAVGHLCHCGVLLAGTQLVIPQDPKLCGAVPQKLSAYWSMGLLLCIVRTLHFPFHIPLCTVPPCTAVPNFISLNLLRVHFAPLWRFLM